MIKPVAANLTDTITEKEIIGKIIPAYEHIQIGRRNKPSAGLHCCNRLSGWPSLGYREASIRGYSEISAPHPGALYQRRVPEAGFEGGW